MSIFSALLELEARSWRPTCKGSPAKATEGRKDDTGKDPWHLFPWDAARCIVKVLGFGARKYAPRNWEKGMAWPRPHDGLIRHLTAWWQGEDKDPETKMSHLWQSDVARFFDRLQAAWKRARRPARQADMRQLSDGLFRLWRVYCIEIHGWRIARTTYGCNSPAATMQESVARSVLEAYFGELEKHIDQEPENVPADSTGRCIMFKMGSRLGSIERPRHPCYRNNRRFAGFGHRDQDLKGGLHE